MSTTDPPAPPVAAGRPGPRPAGPGRAAGDPVPGVRGRPAGRVRVAHLARIAAAADPVPAGRDRLGPRVRHLPGRVPLRRAAGRSRRGLPKPDPDPGGRLRATRAAVPRRAGRLPAGRPHGTPGRRRGLLRGPDRARGAPGDLRAPGRRARRRDRGGDPARSGPGPAGHGGRGRGPVPVADRADRRPGAALPCGRRGPVVRPGGHEPVRGPRAARVRRGRRRGGGHRPRGCRADRARPSLGHRIRARRGPERPGDRADRRGLHRPGRDGRRRRTGRRRVAGHPRADAAGDRRRPVRDARRGAGQGPRHGCCRADLRGDRRPRPGSRRADGQRATVHAHSAAHTGRPP